MRTSDTFDQFCLEYTVNRRTLTPVDTNFLWYAGLGGSR